MAEAKHPPKNARTTATLVAIAVSAATLRHASSAQPAAFPCATPTWLSIVGEMPVGTVEALHPWQHPVLGEVLAVGGNFTLATPNKSAADIALLDVTSGEWIDIDDSLGSGAVYALASAPNGRLLASGEHFTASPTGADTHVLAFDGSSWSPLGEPFREGYFYNGGSVFALLQTLSGDIIAAGSFTKVGDVKAECVARWDGTSWQPMGSGLGWGYWEWFPFVFALAQTSDGVILAGGHFDTASQGNNKGLARWTGQQWMPVFSSFYFHVDAILTDYEKGYAIGGFFNSLSPPPLSPNIASFSKLVGPVGLGNGLSDTVRSLTWLPSGELIAGGYFTKSGSTTTGQVARWSGSAWLALPKGQIPTLVSATAWLPDGRLAVGGQGPLPIALFGCPQPRCPGDCTGDATLNIFDWICFSDAYHLKLPYADCNHDSTLTVLDYICFGDSYSAGCP